MSAYIQSQEKIFNAAIESIEILELMELIEDNEKRSIELAKDLHYHYNKIMLCIFNVRQYEDF